MKKYFKLLSKADLTLIFILIFFALFIFFFQINQKATTYVNVLINDKLEFRKNLNKDEIFKIKKGVIAQIKAGKIAIIENDCKNQICVKQGFSNSVPIVCLPNKILLSLEDDFPDDEILVTY